MMKDDQPVFSFSPADSDVTSQPSNLKDLLQSFWQTTYEQISSEEIDFRNYQLPLARIKKIMRIEEDVKMISGEAPIVFSKACELFILELTLRAWSITEAEKRKTLQRADVESAASKSELFDFLVDFVPRSGNASGSMNAANVAMARNFPNESAEEYEEEEDEQELKQKIVLDDLAITIEARNRRRYALLLSNLLTLGLCNVLWEWFPNLKVKVLTKKSCFEVCSYVYAVNSTLDQVELCPVTVSPIKSFTYRCVKFVYQPSSGSWEDSFLLASQVAQSTTFGQASSGISKALHSERLGIFGENRLEFPFPSLGTILGRQLMQPMNIFQFICFVIWIYQDYYEYASLIIVVTLGSILLTVWDTRRNLSNVKRMSVLDLDVYVLRSRSWKVVSCQDLVPGDVFEVTSTMTTVPCDAVLLDGDCILDESMLTGESIPVSKTAPEEEEDWERINMQHLESSSCTSALLFCGTRIIRARNTNSTPAIALVVRTGFFTAKGALVRSILFPRPNKFKFYRDTMVFICSLFAIAIIGFVVLVWCSPKESSIFDILRKATDLITVVVPPALTAAMAVGTECALRRLKKKNIFCIAPPKINVAGRLNLLCFDKTGTLTEEGLDVMGVVVCSSAVAAKSPIIKTPEELSPLLLLALASCHSIKCVNEEFIGDPLDLKMFEWTKWILEESSSATNSVVSSIVRPPWTEEFDVEEFLQCSPTTSAFNSHPAKHTEYGIIRCFEFVSQLRRMSVIVRQLNSNTMQVFSKGSPESILQLCIPDSVPVDFQTTLDHYTHAGYRVIAVASKQLPESSSWIKVQKTSRAEIESSLTFEGFVVFENKIKPITKSVLTTLRSAQIKTCMCTGDNILTALSVSKECGMLPEDDFLVVFVPTLEEEKKIVTWNRIGGDSTYELDAVTLQLSFHNASPTSIIRYELACTGQVFDWLLVHAPETFERLLVKAQVFARMSPEQKQILVERLLALGYSVGFCGDGANDCGALKAADVGISLSEAEASVAAPFTSNINDIGCVLKVLQEGRCSLQTSFSCFKFIILSVMVQFCTSMLLGCKSSRLSNKQFLYIDMFLGIAIAFANDLFKPADKLTRKQPNSKLISFSFLSDLLGHLIVIVTFQCILSGRMQGKGSASGTSKQHEDLYESYLNTCLFIFSTWQYFYCALVSCVGRPFRQPIWTNRVYCTMIFCVLVCNCAILLVRGSSFISRYLEFNNYLLEHQDRVFIWILILLNGASVLGVELLLPLWRLLGKKVYARRKDRKQPGYKRVEKEFHCSSDSI